MSFSATLTETDYTSLGKHTLKSSVSDPADYVFFWMNLIDGAVDGKPLRD